MRSSPAMQQVGGGARWGGDASPRLLQHGFVCIGPLKNVAKVTRPFSRHSKAYLDFEKEEYRTDFKTTTKEKALSEIIFIINSIFLSASLSFLSFPYSFP